MLRFLLIIILIGYALYKLGLFRVQVGPPRPGNHDQGRRSQGGDVNIDSTPHSKEKGSKFKGGEYVDYEEVK